MSNSGIWETIAVAIFVALYFLVVGYHFPSTISPWQ